jgi:hypothetical protein
VEAGNARELARVVGDDHEIVRERDSGDEVIVAADRSARRLDGYPEARVLFYGAIVEVMAGEAIEEALLRLAVLVGLGTRREP